MAPFFTWDSERERFLAVLAERIGELRGKRVALLTLRNASSNQRFARIAEALQREGAQVDAFDTAIGSTNTSKVRPQWLTTIPVR